MSKPIKRVLIYRLGSLGDTVVTLPCFHLVERSFPDAERRLLTNFPIATKAPPAAAILEGTGLVQGYFRYTVGTRSAKDLLSLWWQLLRWRPQVVVYLAPARGIGAAKRDAAFFRLCGVSRLIGVPDTEERQKNRLLSEDGWLEPEAERLARNLSELGDARLDDAGSWGLDLTAQEHARAEEVLVPVAGRPLVAVSIGTKAQSNDWGRENWREMLKRLAQLYPEYALAITGASVDAEYSEFIAEGWRAASEGNTVLNLCGRLTPRESAAVFARARIFVGHDSGPMHLAAAVQTPCVGIFSARGKPRKWFPHGRQHRVIYHQVDCWGCGLETCIVEKKKCILSITVEEVVEQVRGVLG